MKTTLLSIILFIFKLKLFACTIVSGVDTKGQTWVMNNEDFFHTYSNYVNIYPATKTSLGYITLTYGSPESGIQGGVNEAGLFFDINALPPQTYKLSVGRKPYSGSMLDYLLQHCKSVPQFLKLWETQYMPEMNGIQIHLADKNGNLAIITPDTIVISKKHLTSTNFNVCEANPDKRVCWRYPIAENIISENGISQKSLVKIADATSWKEFTTTLYTNIHNLTTGDIWFYLAEDYGNPWRTNISKLLKGGKQSILLASMFPKNKSLKLNMLIETGGKSNDIQTFLEKSKLSNTQKESVLRLSFLDNFFIEKDFNKAALLFPEWEKYSHLNKRLDSIEMKITKAQYLATIGNNKKAVDELKSIKKTTSRSEELLRNLTDSEDYNTTIKLEGFKDAKVVLIEFKGDYNLFRFLRSTPEGWIMKIKSSRKELKYCFYVDGKRIVDSSQPIIAKQETVKGDFADFNIRKL